MAESGYEPLCTAAEMRAAEEAYPGFPGTAPELMERAGAAVAYEAMRVFPYARRFAVVCGGGSNGGDGRIAARVLREAGREAVETDAVEGCDVVIDALFGTGFHGAPRPEAAALIERINACGLPVVAVDLPSGVDASTGEVAGVGRERHAHRHVPREQGRAPRRAGAVPCRGGRRRRHRARARADRGARATRGAAPAGAAPGRARLEVHARASVLVVGGAPGTTGAPVLTAMAALRADAGYVTLAVPRECLAGRRGPRARAGQARLRLGRRRGDDHGRGGAGRCRRDRAGARTQRRGARARGPAARDASSCRSSSTPTRSSASSRSTRAHPTVLTPHAGELARLLGSDSAWVDAHRLEAARTAAERFGAVVVLKGAGTIVQAPGGGPVVCDDGPAVARDGGTGDVLTGVVAAFLAKGLDPVTAAAAAATAHGLAAPRCRIRPGSSQATSSRSCRRCSPDRPRRDPLVASRVRVEILGSGGAATIPRPGCGCRVCVEARENGRPLRAHGSVDLRPRAEHPLRHARGVEVPARARRRSARSPPASTRTGIPTTRWAGASGRPGTATSAPGRARRSGRSSPTSICRSRSRATSASGSAGWRISSSCATAAGSGSTSSRDGETVEIGGVTVRPFRLAEDYVYAFELTRRRPAAARRDGRAQRLVAPARVTGCDLAVLPMGICEFDLSRASG